MLAWFRALSRLQQALLIVCLLAVCVHAGVVAFRRTYTIGDFDIHREFGRRFLSGEPLYDGGLCYNYMPINALFHAPLALVPAPLAALLRYTAALVCLGLSLGWLRRMTPEQARGASIAVIFTLFLTSHYVLRDLEDSGSHLLFLAMLVGGIYAAWLGRHALAGASLGLAIALKMTPGLLLPFLVWKRHWRLLAWTSAATCLWIALPIVRMGPACWWQHQRQWNEVVIQTFRDGANPANEGNDVRVQNQSLRLAFQHALTVYPPGHPLRVESGPHFTLFDLEPSSARFLATMGLLAVLAAFCLNSRGAYRQPADPAWVVDALGLMLLMLLISPVTWVQHLVWAVPAAYLVVSADWQRRRWGKAAFAFLALFAVGALVLNRGLVGKDIYFWLLANHLHAVCLIILLALMAWLRRGVGVDRGQDGVTTRPTNLRAA
ncbi:MAG TPA: glycosyltransferase family 87 protein [Gemmataceae bacterium]|nr:glycosyltransferase family 87 protein [Gemmataceae bacterium]